MPVYLTAYPARVIQFDLLTYQVLTTTIVYSERPILHHSPQQEEAAWSIHKANGGINPKPNTRTGMNQF